jgi:hypothetical protein
MIVSDLVFSHPFNRTSGELLAEAAYPGLYYSIQRYGHIWDVTMRGSHHVCDVARSNSEADAINEAWSHHRRSIVAAVKEDLK